MGDLSAHFSRAEFADRRSGQLPVIASELLELLEELRRRAGRPLAIVSGYRSCRSNVAAGGAEYSQHLFGRAADIPLGYCTPAVAAAAGATGIGVHGVWAIHVDVRQGPLRTWQYDVRSALYLGC